MTDGFGNLFNKDGSLKAGVDANTMDTSLMSAPSPAKINNTTTIDAFLGAVHDFMKLGDYRY